jgi:hypothetical protein
MEEDDKVNVVGNGEQEDIARQEFPRGTQALLHELQVYFQLLQVFRDETHRPNEVYRKSEYFSSISLYFQFLFIFQIL